MAAILMWSWSWRMLSAWMTKCIICCLYQQRTSSAATTIVWRHAVFDCFCYRVTVHKCVWAKEMSELYNSSVLNFIRYIWKWITLVYIPSFTCVFLLMLTEKFCNQSLVSVIASELHRHKTLKPLYIPP